MTTRILISAVLFSLCVLIGCSKKSGGAKVSGTVTYKDGPVTGGNLAFHSKEGGVYSAVINEQGKYTMTDIPPGEMTVTVDTEALNPKVKKETYTGQSKFGPKTSSPAPGGKGSPMSPMPEGAGPSKVGNYVQIPRSYADKNKSTMKITVKEGDQTIDIPLKD
jgi:hypothetical protein